MDSPTNRREKRALASRARRGIAETEPERVGPLHPLWRLGSLLMLFCVEYFPGRTMGQYFLINFALGAAAGALISGGLTAAVYFLSE